MVEEKDFTERKSARRHSNNRAAGAKIPRDKIENNIFEARNPEFIDHEGTDDKGTRISSPK